MCTKTFYAVITVYAIVLICYVLARQVLPDQAVDQVGGGVMRRPLGQETPCPNDAQAARFSLHGIVEQHSNI